MSGLSSAFLKPRNSFGATANQKSRDLQTPDVSVATDASSVVRGNVNSDDSYLMSQLDFPLPQSRSRFEHVAGAPFTPASSSSSRRGGGGQQTNYSREFCTAADSHQCGAETVSYTHLTLPTIYSV